MADKSEWNTPSMESEGKGDGHQYGRKPIPIAGKLTYSEEEMGHWTPTGIEPTDYDNGDITHMQLFQLLQGRSLAFTFGLFI